MTAAESLSAPNAPQFRALFAAEFKYVWRTLRRLGVAERDVEDVTHDVFVQVYRKLDAYEPSRPLRPWLFGFAFRAASEYRRSPRHRVELLEVEEGEIAAAPASSSNLADQAIARAEDAKLVTDALDALDFERRAVLVAYEIEELPMKEIAGALGIPLDTAYSRLRVARTELAAAVKRLRLRRGGA